MSELIVGYLAWPNRRPGGGIRVHRDGTVELHEPGEGWTPIATLGAEARAELEELTRAAGIPDLPEEVARPPLMRGGSDCEWWTDLDGRPVHAWIRGWTEGNPAAQPSRDLVMRLDRLVAAAQDQQ